MSQNTTTTQTSTTVAVATQTSTTTPAGTVTTTSAITASKTTTVTEPKTLEVGPYFSNPFKSNKIYISNHSNRVIFLVVTDDFQAFTKTLSANGSSNGAGVNIERIQFANPREKTSLTDGKMDYKVLIGGNHAFVSIFLSTGSDEYVMVFENKRVDHNDTFNVKQTHIDAALANQIKYKSAEFKSKEEKHK